MTDESSRPMGEDAESTPPQSQQPTPPPGMPTEDHDEATVLAGAGDFTSGEGLVAFAGIVIIAVWLIFSIIVTEYFISWLMLSLAVAATLLPRLNRETVERVHALPVLMKVIGYAIALIGVFALVEDLRFGEYEDIGDILGALATYAAAVMAFLGARQIKI
ncbi:MAG: hypothetical protein PVJ28_08835 [Acidimicrobiia bacterium]